jgi:hypothetical protein
MNDESIENAASIPLAAKEFGLDTFSLYGLIQQDKLRPKRARCGELVILQVEMDKRSATRKMKFNRKFSDEKYRNGNQSGRVYEFAA